MAADLTKPFAESCCDGGVCAINDKSAAPCGCDRGASYVCERHRQDAAYRVADLAMETVQAREDLMRDTVPAFIETVEPVRNVPGTTIKQVKDFRMALFEKSMGMIDRKGADYNRDQQKAGDTLFNLRVCELLGVVPSAEEGILVRLSDKLMRLISLTKPGREAAVKDESVLDTIADIHNYVDYLGLIWQQRRAGK